MTADLLFKAKRQVEKVLEHIKGTLFEKEFKEFSNDEMFYDAEDYKDEIKALMNKGLSMKSAYFALAGEDKVANIRKDLEVEIEQKLLNNSNKAEKVNVGHEESKDETKRTKYTKKEQEYANELKAITKSTAFFNLEFYDYEKVPDLLAQKIIEENKK